MGQALASSWLNSSSETASLTEAYIGWMRLRFEVTVPSALVTALPASIGPPETNTVGILRRKAARNIPGVILSQLEMHTSASAQWALTMYSMESAMSSRLGSEYSMPPCPIAMPSSMAIVLNSRPMPPAVAMASLTSLPMLRRCTCPGTNWVNEFATATMGLPKSSGWTPVARQRARAPAMLRPWVLVLDLKAGTVVSYDDDGVMFFPTLLVVGTGLLPYSLGGRGGLTSLLAQPLCAGPARVSNPC